MPLPILYVTFFLINRNYESRDDDLNFCSFFLQVHGRRRGGLPAQARQAVGHLPHNHPDAALIIGHHSGQIVSSVLQLQ